MPTPTPSKDMREAFEAEHPVPEYVEWHEDGYYWGRCQRTGDRATGERYNEKWEIWLAASALAEKKERERISRIVISEWAKADPNAIQGGAYVTAVANAFTNTIDRIEKGQP